MAPPKPSEVTSSVVLSMLDGDFEEKLGIAALAGIESVELSGEQAEWSDSRIRDVLKLTRSYRIGMDATSAMPGWDSKSVSMVDPAERDSMLNQVKTSIESARKLEIPMLTLLSGNAIPGRSREEQYASLLEGTKRCGELAADAGVTLLVEPLNDRVDYPGFYLTTCSEGLRLVREVDSPHVRLLYDVYDEYAQTGNALDLIKEAVPYTNVFRVADYPGRQEPGTGEIDYDAVYDEIRDSGYKGIIAMAFRPAGEPVGSLISAVDRMRAVVSKVKA